MSALILLALGALIGFALGTSFSWLAIAAFSIGLAVVSSAILQIQGFGALPGIVIVVACLTVNQIAYLTSAFYRSKVDKDPSQGRHHDSADQARKHQKFPS